MTATELIEKLQKLVDEFGDLEVIVTGCYGSSGDIQEVSYSEDSWLSQNAVVILGSNICSG